MYFVRGAVDSGDVEKWAQVLSVVRGSIYNYYYTGDKTLHLFRTVTFKSPIGISPLLDVENRETLSKPQQENAEKLDELARELRIININGNKLSAELMKNKNEFERMLTTFDL